MLELKLSLANEEDAAGKRIILTDNTGLYSSTNLGGFGAPNEVRGNLAIYPIGYLHSSKGETSLVEFDSFNPLSATSWNALPKTDGWYSFQLVYALIDQEPLLTAYQVGDIIFSESDFKLLQKQIDQASGLPLFVEVKPETLLASNGSKVVEQLFLANLSFQKIALNRRKIELMINSENISNTKQIRVVQEAYDRVRSLIQGAIYEFCIGNKYEAARFIEFILTNNYEELQGL